MGLGSGFAARGGRVRIGVARSAGRESPMGARTARERVGGCAVSAMHARWCARGAQAHAARGAGETRIRVGCPCQAVGVGRVGARSTRNGRRVRPRTVMPARWCTRGACAMPGMGAAAGIDATSGIGRRLHNPGFGPARIGRGDRPPPPDGKPGPHVAPVRARGGGGAPPVFLGGARGNPKRRAPAAARGRSWPSAAWEPRS
jgi:hypothetical protein